jgi:hypothetical protein
MTAATQRIIDQIGDTNECGLVKLIDGEIQPLIDALAEAQIWVDSLPLFARLNKVIVNARGKRI